MLAWRCRNIQERTWRFCAWKFCTSTKMHEEQESSGRAPKRAKFDGQLLRSFPQGILHVHTIGVALLEGAHLKTLKEYDQD